MSEVQVTEEQAAEALRQLVADRQPVAVEAAPAVTPEPQTVAEPESAPEVVETEAAPVEAAPESDDITSLKSRLAEREKAAEAAEQQYQSRLQALQQRQQESERILRERYLRKSTAADRALKILKATRSESGVPETEVDRVIQEVEGTMNPQSASYVPPVPTTESAEDQAIVLNAFLNEKQMDSAEAEEFGKWIKTEGSAAMHPNEQALAYRDIDGFLRVAHMRYGQSIQQKANQRASAVDAVKTVQRVQKQAAQAASATPVAPRKTIVSSTPPNTIDYEKVTPDDVAKWLQQSIEQYR